MFPDDVQYTAEHEWVRTVEGGVRIGITAYAQESLGDVVFVSLPAVGAAVAAGEPLGEIESTKSVSDIYAPVGGTVTARNDALDATPELVNSDPYGEGWLIEIADQGDPVALLSAADYQALVGG
ncbi:MAG TPA: glycine cleavage system protein GcvH [Mycobacteriales bacterium]|nr:glycine cleavage system protein GcvH [Mycobacteriales bacterium]